MYKPVDRTELENHLIQHFRDSNDGFLDGLDVDGPVKDSEGRTNPHLLLEFVDGYTFQREVYTNHDSENEELMDDFLKYAQADIDGQFEYSVKAFERIVEALTTFGL